METVVAFNNELSGLYDSRPPISKAKMAAITKSAMRAIKFYKHVVQSVEKFILKCKPEYKVPGLYVIDSIVRQSRHQYGTEKDVFAPRFQRNLTETFANLFRCAPEDKSRIIRVLNLWQKNNVFKAEVIQPIFDLADPNHPIYHQMPPVVGMSSGPPNLGPGPSSSGALTLADIATGANGLNSSGMSNLDLSMGGGGVSHGNDDKLGNVPDLSCSRGGNLHDPSSRRHIEQHFMKRQYSSMPTSTSNSKSRACYDAVGSGSGASQRHHSKYAKSSHEMDYDVREIIDDDEDDVIGDDHHCMGDDSPPTSSNLLDNNNLKQLLNDPNVLRQLQTLQNFHKFKQQEENQSLQQHLQNVLKGTAGMPPGMGMGIPMNMNLNDVSDMNKDVEFISEQQNIEVINLDGGDSRSPSPDRDRYKRSRRNSSRSRSRSPRDRGSGRITGGINDRDRDSRGSRRRGGSSRSRSRSRSPRSSRRRGSSRDRGGDRERSTRDKERDREHERERRKKGLPDVKKEHLSVCSTTLWVGHLSKLVYQEELSDTFGEYGDIVSIDQIVPRGCAFIVMNRRQDAHKAMQSLKSHKMQGRAITISWAAGKGVKSKEWKDFWDLELGVTYIPWQKLNPDTDFDSLEEGGMFDEDTMPAWMKDKINQAKNNTKDSALSVVASVGMPGGELGPSMAVRPPGLLFGIDTTQPPPVAPPPHGGPGGQPPPPALMGMVPGQFPMAPPPMGGPPPPRMLGPPMGPINPMTGMPMPPNIVPGMPPPMIMPPAMMPPGFPLGLPPGAQFPPPPGALPPPMTAAGPPAVPTVGGTSGSASDDQMDIEMELEDAPPTGPPPNFNQPPPMFVGAPNNAGAAPAPDAVATNELFQRERGSRWGGREDVVEAAERWRAENGGGGAAPPPVAIGGGGNAFNEARARLNLNPNQMDIQQMQRPDFMDFDNRGGPQRPGVGGGMGGPRGVGGGNHNGDFFPSNMNQNPNQNRFNQPTSLMQMRIPPPVAFNQRMGGPGPGNGPGSGSGFLRNQGAGGGGGGGGGAPGPRQQGPGFFNPRNPFNDNQRGRGGGRGGMGNRGGRWSDDEDDGNNFKRRGGGGGGPGGNRFRDRDQPGNQRGRGGSREDRGERGGSQNQRGSREDVNRNSVSSTDEKLTPINKDSNQSTPAETTTATAATPAIVVPPGVVPNVGLSAADTEEDWDRELEEYDARMEAEQAAAAAAAAAGPPAETAAPAVITSEQSDTPVTVPDYREEEPVFIKPTSEVDKEVTTKPPTSSSPACTPLYDELPPPAVNPKRSPDPISTDTAASQEVPPAASETIESAEVAVAAAVTPDIAEPQIESKEDPVESST